MKINNLARETVFRLQFSITTSSGIPWLGYTKLILSKIGFRKNRVCFRFHFTIGILNIFFSCWRIYFGSSISVRNLKWNRFQQSTDTSFEYEMPYFHMWTIIKNERKTCSNEYSANHLFIQNRLVKFPIHRASEKENEP